MSAETCAITMDGWCSEHSTADGPAYCVTAETVDQLRRARFHERENYARAIAAEKRVTELESGAGDDGPCATCGQAYSAWRAEDSLWNLVMGGPDAKDDPGGMLCPNDFLRLADEQAPVRGAWVVGTQVRPEFVVKEESLREAGTP